MTSEWHCVIKYRYSLKHLEFPCSGHGIVIRECFNTLYCGWQCSLSHFKQEHLIAAYILCCWPVNLLSPPHCLRFQQNRGPNIRKRRRQSYFLDFFLPLKIETEERYGKKSAQCFRCRLSMLIESHQTTNSRGKDNRPCHGFGNYLDESNRERNYRVCMRIYCRIISVKRLFWKQYQL